MNFRFGAIARAARFGIAFALLPLSAGAGAQAGPGKHTVTMAQMRYGTLPGKLKVGDTITWINRDTVPHTVTARDRSFDLRIAPGRQASMVVKKAGKIPIYCIMHPMMRGVLTVAAQ